MNLQTAPSAQRHVVCFYTDDDDLASVVAADLAERVRAGRPAVVIATAGHAAAFDAALTGLGVTDRASLVVLDAHETLGRIMRGDRPDPDLFEREVGTRVRQAAAGGDEVWAFGELVGLLWDAGNVGAALELETLWEVLARDVRFRLACGYPIVQGAGDDDVRQVCDLHTAVVGKEPLAAMPSPRPPVWVERREFEPDPTAPRAARRFVTGTLARSEPHVRDEAALVVTELATNAVIHAGTPFVVELERVDGVLRIAVADDAPGEPAPQPLQTDVGSGRGLVIISALARNWGVDRTATGGKLVWVELPV